MADVVSAEATAVTVELAPARNTLVSFRSDRESSAMPPSGRNDERDTRTRSLTTMKDRRTELIGTLLTHASKKPDVHLRKRKVRPWLDAQQEYCCAEVVETL